LDNLPSGTVLESQSLPFNVGGWEYITFWDDILNKSLNTMSHLPIFPGSTTEMGLGFALLSFSLATRLILMPLGIYGQVCRIKMSAIKTDMDKISQEIK
jgi:hypothetical protein